MQQLPEALTPLAAYRQFILYKLVPRDDGKTDKFPCDLAGNVRNAHDPTIWLDAETTIATASVYGEGYGAGFVFTEADPFYFFDVDNCLLPDGSGWNEIALELIARCTGAAVEVSQSGRGLHIIGTGRPTTPTEQRRKKSIDNSFDLYTEGRFVALTGYGAQGSAAQQVDQQQIDYIVSRWLQRSNDGGVDEWTNEPVEGWNGPQDDKELIDKALSVRTAGGAFDNRCTFRDLWEGNETAFQQYADDQGVKDFDSSKVDAALAQHLAFWTGNDCERILRLMWQSGLVREKWREREDYLYRTILRAVSQQSTVYSAGGDAGPQENDESGAPKLKGTAGQIQWAAQIRAQKLAEVASNPQLTETLCRPKGPGLNAGFWIENRDRTAEQIAEMLTPVDAAVEPLGDPEGPTVLTGYQFLGIPQQIEHFAGCVYVQSLHRIFTPKGALLEAGPFNATYGGYSFQLENDGSKTTRKAWEAFTESQAIRYPKAETTCFRPQLPPGALIREEGQILVNTYVPIKTPRKKGDLTPFMEHLKKMLPNEHDRQIILSYMAACIQYKGVKFQWAPLLQGVPGNGKTLLTRCLMFAIGDRYSHMPPASEISEKFNAWLFGKLLIGIEDVYVPEHKREVIEILKPMITNERLARRGMQQDQVMADNRANFILNSNHKDAIRKTRNDRRFAVFYTEQQTIDDLARDGMLGGYFPALYDWLRAEGYAIVADYLENYEIPNELNPAGHCDRAPETSSTGDAVAASQGAVEQEILEAIDEGRPGFAGGWVSSMALDRLLRNIRKAQAVPPNRRRELLQDLGYDYHPTLRDGRVNNYLATDAGKPRLFIRNGHIHANLESAVEVARAYEAAQQPGGTSEAGQKFGGN